MVNLSLPDDAGIVAAADALFNTAHGFLCDYPDTKKNSVRGVNIVIDPTLPDDIIGMMGDDGSGVVIKVFLPNETT